MNIAHILPRSALFPLSKPNARYDWVRQLAELQIKQGHTVTIYCNPNSLSGNLTFSGVAESSGHLKADNIETFRLAFTKGHDIYHSHFDDLQYELAQETDKPIIYTQHWWPTDKSIEFSKTIPPSNVWAVPPTRYMYTFDIEYGIQTKGHIYHGIDLNKFHPSKVKKNRRLLFVGRIDPDKNLEIAIATAKQAGIGLDIVGKISKKNTAYWDTLKHLVDGEQIKYHGTKNQLELLDYYSSARALLAPFNSTEAFGLVAIEAQACGLPVIMLRSESRAELLDEGKTGFLCTNSEEFVNAVQNVANLNPDDCIEFAKKFDINAMAKAYEKLYEKLTTI